MRTEEEIARDFFRAISKLCRENDAAIRIRDGRLSFRVGCLEFEAREGILSAYDHGVIHIVESQFEWPADGEES